MFSIIIKVSFKDVCGFIISRKLFWILTTQGFFIQILTVNNNKLFPIIFWIFLPLRIFFIQILAVNNRWIPLQIRFFYFLEYWLIPFGVLQTCCKIQKCKKNVFVLYKKSMWKNIFKTSNIFFIYKKKNVQNMLGYWLYLAHKKTFFIFLLKHKHHN